MITKTLAFSLLLLGSVGVASADYADGMRYYEQQQYRQALQEFDQAARSGDADAQYMLGRLNQAGNGTTQNFVEAHKWYNLAASHGHRHAGEARDSLAERMTTAQIANAQQAARNWGPEKQSSSQSQTDRETLSDRERVTEVQRELNRLGYDAGPVDGVMGNRTSNAIYQYQVDKDIARDGRASSAVLERLRQTQKEERATSTESQSTSQARVALRDDFGDGDYRRNPSWTVISGDFEVDQNGLHSVVDTQQEAGNAARGLSSDRPEEVGLAVLGMILEQRRNGGQDQPATPAEPAQIFVNTPVDNAFRMEVELASSQRAGSVELGLFQGNRPNGTGYRLVYSADSQPTLRLIRQISGNAETVDQYNGSLDLEDNRFHRIVWVRDEDGRMEVRVDERRLLRAQDNGLRDPFQGFTLTNRGGDFTLGRIRIEE
ncbi:MAG: peptidoglycan-binding protein [Guyparkeria sp.]